MRGRVQASAGSASGGYEWRHPGETGRVFTSEPRDLQTGTGLDECDGSYTRTCLFEPQTVQRNAL